MTDNKKMTELTVYGEPVTKAEYTKAIKEAAYGPMFTQIFGRAHRGTAAPGPMVVDVEGFINDFADHQGRTMEKLATDYQGPTVTGRFNSQTPDMHEIESKSHGRISIIDCDFSDIEARLLAFAADEDMRVLVIDSLAGYDHAILKYAIDSPMWRTEAEILEGQHKHLRGNPVTKGKGRPAHIDPHKRGRIR